MTQHEDTSLNAMEMYLTQFHAQRFKNMPETLKINIRFIAISSLFTLTECNGYRWDINLLIIICVAMEIACTYHWDICETDDHVKMYEACVDTFGSFPDAAYYVMYNEPRTELKQSLHDQLKMLYSKCNRFLLVVPIALAVFANLVFMLLIMGNIREVQHSSCDITCHSFILVPRIMNIMASLSFLAWHREWYMRKHWDSREKTGRQTQNRKRIIWDHLD